MRTFALPLVATAEFLLPFGSVVKIGFMNTRNRIVDHRRIRAGDLIPHELNWRVHPPGQREALRAIYREVGFARSLLAYQLADGRLQLIDGHLRGLDPDMLVDVEVLDVTPDEARKLLLSMDSLAGLAETNMEAAKALRRQAACDSPALAALWDSVAASAEATQKSLQEAQGPLAPQFLILIECHDEQQQVDCSKSCKPTAFLAKRAWVQDHSPLNTRGLTAHGHGSPLTTHQRTSCTHALSSRLPCIARPACSRSKGCSICRPPTSRGWSGT